MDPNGQGDDPNGRGAYYNYNQAQRHDHPSSSSPRWLALPLLTPWPQLQPQGGYPSSFNVGIPTDGNISGNDFAPLAVPMPGPGYHFSEVAGPLVPNAIASQNQYQPWANQPHPDSAAVFPASGYNPVYLPEAGVYAQQPSSATVFNAPGYNSNPHAFVYQPGAPLYAQPGAATDFSAWGGNAKNDPYTSAGLVAPPANANQGASCGPVAGDPNRSRLALQNFLANDLLAAVQRANIRRANMRGDLEAIVSSVIWHQCNGVSLMEVAEPRSGETALKELVRLAALHLGPEALQLLFRCLVDGWIMEQSNGPGLLRHFFTTFDYHHCSIFVHELAVRRFWDMVTSRIGSMSLMRCVEIAGYTEQGTFLQDTIVTHTLQIARSESGALFLRDVFEKGSYGQLKERIMERVLDNLVELSMGRYGNFVVQACFVPSHRVPLPLVPLLQHGLQAFSHLPDEQLRGLVQNHWAGYVLRRLLRTSVERDVAQEEAMELADRILGVGAAGDETDAELPRPAGDRREQAIAILQ